MTTVKLLMVKFLTRWSDEKILSSCILCGTLEKLFNTKDCCNKCTHAYIGWRRGYSSIWMLLQLSKFETLCGHYFNGPLKGASEAEKCSDLQIWLGEEGIELISTWKLEGGEDTKLDTYWSKLEAYVLPKTNFRLCRFKLRALKQEQGGTCWYLHQKHPYQKLI